MITTAANGDSEIMTPGVHGEVVSESSDITALSEALRKWLTILDDPVSAEKTHALCSQLAAGFTLEQNLRETLAVIREVIAEKK